MTAVGEKFKNADLTNKKSRRNCLKVVNRKELKLNGLEQGKQNLHKISTNDIIYKSSIRQSRQSKINA